MQAGKYRDRCEFFHPAEADQAEKDFGNLTSGYEAKPFYSSRGRLDEQRGRERIEGGQTTAVVAGTLKLYSSEVARTIVPEADMVKIEGVEYQIRAGANHDRRNREIELVVERGVAV